MVHLDKPSLPTFSSDVAVRDDWHPDDMLTWIGSFHAYFQEAVFETLVVFSDPFVLAQALNIFMQFRVGCLIRDPSSPEVLSDLHIMFIGLQGHFISDSLSFTELFFVVSFDFISEFESAYVMGTRGKLGDLEIAQEQRYDRSLSY